MVKLWSLVVVVLEGKMHWAIGRIGWRGRRERWRSIVVVVVMVMMVYLDAVVFIVVLIIFTVVLVIFTVVFTVVFPVVFPVVCHGRVVLGD